MIVIVCLINKKNAANPCCTKVCDVLEFWNHSGTIRYNSHYLAYDSDEPVAVAAMYIQDGAAHLTDAATLSGFRRRGIQKAMIHQRVVDGLKLGCGWFTSETAAPKPRNPLVSHRNLRRTGFEIVYIRAKYVCESVASQRSAR